MIAALNACRFVYNWALEDRANLYAYAKCSTNFYDQSKYLPTLKDANKPLKNVHVHTLQDALRRADRAFEAFFRRCRYGEKPGYPRFKGRNRYDSFTFKEWTNGVKFDGKRLSLSKIGRVRIVLHRPIRGVIKTCTIKRRADGWYALFSVEQSRIEPTKRKERPVGIDVGVESFVALSTGRRIENPRYYVNAQRGLAIAQRKVAKRKKGSARRARAVRHLRLEHLRLARTRRDFQFKTAKRLVERFHPIYVEKLNVAGMLRNRTLAKHIADASWSSFLSILSNKAENAGSAVVAVEAKGTSQECSRCGKNVPKTLSERIHQCPHCGYTAHRDVNAAKNVLKRGRAGPSARGRRKTRPMTREAAGL